MFGDVSATAQWRARAQSTAGRCSASGDDIAATARPTNTRSDTAHAGFALNGTKAKWRWSRDRQWRPRPQHQPLTDRDDADFPEPRPRALDSTSGDLTATANGTLFELPAGDAIDHPSLGAAPSISTASARREGVTSSNRSAAPAARAAINIDLPISRRNRDFSALGNLTLNANAEVDAAVRLRNADHARRGRQLVAASTGSISSPAGRARKARRRSSNSATRSSKPPARGFSISPPARRCSSPRPPAAIPISKPIAARCGSWAPIGSRSTSDRSAPARRICPLDGSTGRSPASSGRPPRSRPPSPNVSTRDAGGQLIAPTCARSISTRRARMCCGSGFDFTKPLQVAAPVAGGARSIARAIRVAAARPDAAGRRRRAAADARPKASAALVASEAAADGAAAAAAGVAAASWRRQPADG